MEAGQPADWNPAGTPLATASTLVEAPGFPSEAIRCFSGASGGSNAMSDHTFTGSVSTAARARTSPPSPRSTVTPSSSRRTLVTTARRRNSPPTSFAIASTKLALPSANDSPTLKNASSKRYPSNAASARMPNADSRAGSPPPIPAVNAMR